jgi:hypothetical protein
MEVGARYSDLRANRYVGRFELLQDAAEVLLRFSITVLDCGVEIVHAGANRPSAAANCAEVRQIMKKTK